MPAVLRRRVRLKACPCRYYTQGPSLRKKTGEALVRKRLIHPVFRAAGGRLQHPRGTGPFDDHPYVDVIAAQKEHLVGRRQSSPSREPFRPVGGLETKAGVLFDSEPVPVSLG